MIQKEYGIQYRRITGWINNILTVKIVKISLFSFLEMILVYKRIYRYVLCVTVFLEILKETKDACTCNRVKWSRGLRPSLHTRVQ